MLAVFTTESLICLDHPALKRPPSTAPSTSSLLSEPVCCTWAPDNSSVFLATSTDIQQYNAAGTFTRSVHVCKSGQITALASKDKGNTVVFSTAQQVHSLEVHSDKIVQTFDTHKALVTALALSNDGSLLATTSAAAAHVHNLTHGAHTVLRGLSAGTGAIAACVFHPHSRTRLLLGAGTVLLAYDTTRPSGPIKTVLLTKEKGCSGDIIAIASSPFSKTLVAVASSGGTIGLVDLDKEKGLFRVLSVRVPLTSLVFSPEGATIFAGTENGKVLVQELRSLDKSPKSISVSDSGARVVAMCIQKKIKGEEAPQKATTAKPLVQQDTNKNTTRRPSDGTLVNGDKKAAQTANPPAATSPALTRTAAGQRTPAKTRAASGGTPRPARTRVSSTSAAAASPSRVSAHRVGSVKSPARKVSGGITKRVFSPPKSKLMRTAVTPKLAPAAMPNTEDKDDMDELHMSVRIDDLLALPKPTKAKENVNPAESVPSSTVPSAMSARTTTEGDTARPRTRTRTTSSSRSSASASGTSSSGPSAAFRGSADVRAKKVANGSTKSRTRSVSRPKSPTLPAPSKASTRSRTPSPELPAFDSGASARPIPLAKAKGKGKELMGGMGVLGLGTPEVERWVRAGDVEAAGEREGKHVGFASEGGNHESGDEHIFPDDEHVDYLDAREDAQPELAMQVSPRRPASAWAPVVSPLRLAGSPRAGQNTAQDLLQTLLRDAMYDFRQETRSEMVGLHLDLVRMGRGWRREMREAMAEFGGEIRALREENTRLREENERLRRGY
ncbi:quinon protein alcohol dehydrogenase-like superfamily [Sparassis latifolia]